MKPRPFDIVIETAFLKLSHALLSNRSNDGLRSHYLDGDVLCDSFVEAVRGWILRWSLVVYALSCDRFERDLDNSLVGEWGPLREAFGATGSWSAHCAWSSCLWSHFAALGMEDSSLWDIGLDEFSQATVDDASFREIAGALSTLVTLTEEGAFGMALGDAFSRTLRLHLVWDKASRTLVCREDIGSARRSSGSYYSPKPLVTALLEQSLRPRLEALSRQPMPTQAILALRLCDPSCGAGHFLTGAADMMVEVLTRLVPERDDWMAEVVQHCLYGVDLQQLAVWLCRAHLWIRSGASLSHWVAISAHIQHGNSLFGAGGKSVGDRIPASAFQPIGADERKVVTLYRKQHKAPPDDLPLFAATGQSEATAQTHADAWCTSFVCDKQSSSVVITNDTLLRVSREALSEEESALIQMWRERFRFFHWYLAFPEIFSVQRGGFDLIVGNPPWERIKLQEKEYFASRIPAIAQAPRAAARREMIAALADEDPTAYEAYLVARRCAEGMAHFIRRSALYPMSCRGDVNLYTCFIERSQHLIRDDGTVALLVPSGIATDHTTQAYFRQMIEEEALVSLYDFENAERYFPDVSARFRFCFLCLKGNATPSTGPARFLFFGRHMDELSPDILDGRAFSLTPRQLALLNPNTRTCPIFRTARDARLTLDVYQRIPVLWDESMEDEPPVRFVRMFDMTNDSQLFVTAQERAKDRKYLPLYEGKMFEQYDHRYADVITTDNTSRPGQPSALSAQEHEDPARVVVPQYYIPSSDVDQALGDGWQEPWLLVFKDVTSPTNSRTFLATILPRCGVANSAPLFCSFPPDAVLAACLCANINSFVLDYIARQKISSLHMNYFIVKQLPFLPWSRYDAPCPWSGEETLSDWLVTRVLSLVYTSWDLAPFARACGYEGAPLSWDEERRFQHRCEIDAAMMLLYDIDIADAAYILDAFPVIRRRDEEGHGTFRTKERILSMYEGFAG